MNYAKSAFGMLRCTLLAVQPATTVFSRGAKKKPAKVITSDHRPPSICRICFRDPEPKPCFDQRFVSIERGSNCHAKLIYSYLYKQYWPREPSVTSLWMSQNSCYLHQLSEKIAYSGDRYLAIETDPATRERKLVGLAAAYKVFPWTADELEEWAHFCDYKPDRYRCYFNAHCLRSPNLFARYHAEYIYDVEVLSTSSEVAGLGIGTRLLRAVMIDAKELRHPVLQVIAYSSYAASICKKLGLNREWAVDYRDYVDETGKSVFFPRPPHLTVSVWSKPFTCAYGEKQPCKPPW